MAFRCLRVLRNIRSVSVINHNKILTSSAVSTECKPKQYKTESNFVNFEDPDTFGTLSLSGRLNNRKQVFEDEGDKEEEQFHQNKPLKSQKLTTKQYADLIKQYIKHKRLKEAFDVLEVRMLKEDRVKPENYIYNILIGACAQVGYTKKAFKLYNEMKRRALKPTGDTYTCLFHACANSPWPADGLKNAHHLRELLLEKRIECNLTNYNAMIKAFGRCGDLPTSFKIVDEMITKKIKIRVHTFNHLLHACISDKNSGLRHALVVWRKMLSMREKPNIYSFNLMLKCVKECNLGTKEDIEELITIIEKHIEINNTRLECKRQSEIKNTYLLNSASNGKEYIDDNHIKSYNKINEQLEGNNEITCLDENPITIQIVDKTNKSAVKAEERIVPNLLSKVLNMQQVLSLREVHTVQEKFAVVGGQDDFFKEMETYSVKPDIKVFTQMLPLLEETREAENKLIETMKSFEIKADIDFYNMLIKKRCLRSDYEGAFDVMEMIEKEAKYRKKRFPLKKKIALKVNIMTYGVLAMACDTKEKGVKLLNEMKEKQLKVNIQILGALLRQGTTHNQFGYIVHIMNVVNEEKLKVNSIFLKHLEDFIEKCSNITKQTETGQQRKCSEGFVKAFKRFSEFYTNWLKEVDTEEILSQEHPWKQFREYHPVTVQRQNIEIKEPKRFYKRNRKFVRYVSKL